ncbi:hypothetical protein D7V93_36465 [Corallococcus llansteffanensis]|uniref:Uncharacterized protein n=1 Tax=Corallococcus llansteffanensis TaxID=2316731 RepID=A0A3A8NXD7_9BACT|nr:hypothetical protein D7V93_36465 [Corallococcus llansteffanensis]
MSRLTVKHVTRDHEPFGDDHDEVFREGTLVARFSHDDRGDETRIVFVGGCRAGWAARRCRASRISGTQRSPARGGAGRRSQPTSFPG